MSIVTAKFLPPIADSMARLIDVGRRNAEYKDYVSEMCDMLLAAARSLENAHEGKNVA